jgi:hypothetical protein
MVDLARVCVVEPRVWARVYRAGMRSAAEIARVNQRHDAVETPTIFVASATNMAYARQSQGSFAM